MKVKEYKCEKVSESNKVAKAEAKVLYEEAKVEKAKRELEWEKNKVDKDGNHQQRLVKELNARYEDRHLTGKFEPGIYVVRITGIGTYREVIIEK